MSNFSDQTNPHHQVKRDGIESMTSLQKVLSSIVEFIKHSVPSDQHVPVNMIMYKSQHQIPSNTLHQTRFYSQQGDIIHWQRGRQYGQVLVVAQHFRNAATARDVEVIPGC